MSRSSRCRHSLLRWLGTRALRRGFTLVCLLCLLLPLHAVSQQSFSGAASLERVRENLAYHVIRLVHWPSPAFRSANDPILVTVVEPPHGSIVSELFRARAAYFESHAGSRPHGRGYAVRAVRRPGDDASSAIPIEDAHVIYFAGGTAAEIAAVLERADHRPILTIGESKEFVYAGGMVALVVEQDRMRPYVDLEAVHAAGLRMGAELLRHAHIVRPSGEAP